MIAQPREKLIICPVCRGTCYAESEARRIRVGMNFWIEKQCTCCHASGRTTRSQYLIWLENRQHPAQFGYLLRSES